MIRLKPGRYTRAVMETKDGRRLETGWFPDDPPFVEWALRTLPVLYLIRATVKEHAHDRQLER